MLLETQSLDAAARTGIRNHAARVIALTGRLSGSTIAAMKSSPRKFQLTADILLRAYSIGVFPMAESREARELFWVEPQERGVFPLDNLIVSRSLAKTVRSDRFRVVADRDFPAVMRACAERENTWINDEILRLYCSLFDAGHAHSIEVYESERVGRGPLRRQPARRLLRREHVSSRARRVEGRARAPLCAAAGRRFPPSRHPVPDRAPGEPGRCRGLARSVPALLAEAMAGDGEFGAWPPEAAMPGARGA